MSRSHGFASLKSAQLHRPPCPAVTWLRSTRCQRRHVTSVVSCQAQQPQAASDNRSSSSSTLRAIEVSRSIAASRAAESSRQDRLFADPYAVTLSNQQQQHGSSSNTATPQQRQQQQQREAVMDVIATRYIDECLLNAVAATNVNSIQSGDYRQVVLFGDGMDCRPFRLPWPPGTLLFLVAPAEVHEHAEAQLAAAAAGGDVEPAHVMRGCLLRRVNMNLAAAGSSSSSSVIFMHELQKAGFRADRLSVWAIQGLHNQGLCHDHLRNLLTEITNLAAFHSLVVGELPGPMSRQETENILAEAGLLGAVVGYDQNNINYGRWDDVQNAEAENAGVGDNTAAAAAAAGDDVSHDRWLVTGQQLRLSLEQMGIYEEWSAEYADSDVGDDFIGNFS